MDSRKKINIMCLLVSTLAFIVITIGASYSLFNYSVKGKTQNKIVTGTYVAPTLKRVGSSSYKGEMWNYKDSITKVVFQNSISPIENAAYSYDISENKDNSVISYLVENVDDTSTYTAYIQANRKIMANKNSSYLFYNFSKLESIEGLEYLDTSNATNMSYMFDDCSSLVSLNLSNFNTSKATNMDRMFYACKSLASLDLSNFDTSKVTKMSQMFDYCSSLVNLDLSNFNTSNVTDMSSMFYYCISLTSLDVSEFDTSNVTDMSSMFSWCSSLTSLDLSSFNTSKVTDMGWMFYCCKSLINLNISNFDTSKVTDMGEMFDGCSSLINLDLSNFNTSNVTDMGLMFDGCSSLINLDLSNFNTSKVTNMSNMFRHCEKLVNLNLSNFDTSNVTNMSEMFYICSSLTSLDLSNFNFDNVTNISSMLSNCYKLTTTINIRNNSIISYSDAFNYAATNATSQITVNYTEESSDLVDLIIATKSSNSNVVKGNLIPSYNITIDNSEVTSDVTRTYAGKIVTLNAPTNKIVTSFKVNGELVTGNTFVMPNSDVSITDITMIDAVIVESEHNPYPNSLSNQVYYENTFDGATSLTVTLEYQTESTSYDWIYLYDSSTSTTPVGNKKYGGSTKTTEVITINSNYLKIVFKTDSSGNNYYGFKATIIPNYT